MALDAARRDARVLRRALQGHAAPDGGQRARGGGPPAGQGARAHAHGRQRCG